MYTRDKGLYYEFMTPEKINWSKADALWVEYVWEEISHECYAILHVRKDCLPYEPATEKLANELIKNLIVKKT